MTDASDSGDAGRTRRRFLVQSASALSAVAAGGVRAQTGPPRAPDQQRREAAILRAVAAVTLPTAELGAARLEQAVTRFERWRDGVRPVAELDHPYLSSDEVRYGPADPRPAWAAQLEALELESRQRHELAYADLDRARREALLRSHLRRHLPRERGETALPAPLEAPHVALALMAWFYSTPAANDLCYGRAIRRHSCRGLPSATAEPAPLDDQALFTDD
ncbi:MAG TPA: hypothetical protein VMT85_01665 [Thermoanaerobaculia bacterium]|nr:hypothetical protein [Thermoanaerobaculia bacterium]